MSATSNSGLRDAVLRSLGGGSGPVEDGLRDAVLASLGGSYVAGGPGGIPGAKEGLPAQPTPQDPWSMGAPVFDAPEPKFDPQTIKSMLAFKQNVKAMGGDIDGKSDAEVFGLMQRFNQTGGNEITANDQTTTPGDEFGRGLRRGVAYGLPAGLPGVVAMRENEQVQRAPEGFAGFAGQTLGGFAGLLDPGKAPENFAAIALTGGAGRMLAGPVEAVGKRVSQSLGAEAGARAVNMIREAVENAGQGGGMAALNEIGQIPADDWTNKPGESVWRVVKAAGVGAAAGGTLGAGFGAARKAVPVPRATLPERVFSGTLDADAAQAAQEGRQAMQDVRGVYSAAPRAGEMDPAVIAAARDADRMAMEQARASASAIESIPEPAREPTPVMEIPNGKERQGQGRQEGLLSQEQPAPEAKAPAVDSLSYTDLRKRAAALGVLDGGPKNKAALIERVTAAEAGSQAEVSPRVDTASTSKAAQASEGPAPTREVPQTESSRQALDRAASPNPTRQPWEMTKADVDALTYDEFLEADRKMGKVYGDLYWRLKNENVDPADVELHKRIIAATDLFHDRSEAFDAERKARQEVASKKISNGEPWSVTRAAFVSHHKTGSISESAYEKYATREGVSFLGKPEKYPEVVGGRDGIEYRTGNAKDTIVAFDKEGPIGWVSNEFGVPGVFVISDYQRRGVGTELLDLWMSAKPPNQKIGQMTGSGQSMAGAYHKRLVTRALSEGRPVPPAVLADYPDLVKPKADAGQGAKQPWEMTREEVYGNLTGEEVRAIDRAMTPVEKRILLERGIDRSTVEKDQASRRGMSGAEYRSIIDDARRQAFYEVDPHASAVRNALREGRPVPPEVLADYPDLAANAKPPTPTESGTTPAGTAATRVEPPKASEKPTTPEAPPATVPPVEPTPTPETRPDAVSTPKPPDDIPPRRVVNTPEPGEPEGPITGIRHAMVDADRERLGINTWDGPEVRTRQASLDQAIARGINKRALDIAASVRAKPRLLNDIELAGMHHRMYEISKDIDARVAERDRLPDGPDKDSVTTELDRLGAEFGAIADVTQKYGGEDIARTLSYRNAIIKEDFSIARMKYRAEKAKGSKLTPEESAKIETMSKQLEEANTRIAKLEADVESARAESTVNRHASTKRAMPKEAREKIIVDLAAKARALIDTGCR